MKPFRSVFAVAMGAVLSLSLLAGCGGKTEAPVAARICFDNLPDDGISIAAEDTRYEIANVESRIEYDADGNEAAEGTVATYENGVLTAKSEGTVKLTLKGGKSFRVEVVPAYVTDPGYQYTGKDDDYDEKKSTLLGHTHDPSLIEVEENGKPAYYIFSTGWGLGNEIRRSEDLIRWTYMGKTTGANTRIPDMEKWLQSKNDDVHISWWAPDIVEAYNGGYWLYTCAVSAGATDAEGYRKQDDGLDYSLACIVLFHSDSLEKESFEYEGVLMQSCIPKTGGSIDVNSIDPQIIYSPDGKMYMAYGSFGTGNWMLELDPKTGLRKDGFYQDNEFLGWEEVRDHSMEAQTLYSAFKDGEEVKTDYYGTMISQANMEAPVIARHDNVEITDETGAVLEKAKTYYYSMHSYNGLDIAYQMWGGRSESPMGRYTSVGGASIFNNGYGNSARGENTGNKYMGSFTWANKTTENNYFELDIVLPGHNDLFTTKDGTNIAAYITRSSSYNTPSRVFLVQLHQYYLNSMGDICINPNRYGKEISRTVTKEELFKYTDGGKFKMVALENSGYSGSDAPVSVDVVLTEDGKITRDGSAIGNWVMYGKGYIKFTFSSPLANTEETVYYGVVRPSWLNDQNKSGFTITCMGHSGANRSMAMFMNNYSTLDVE